MAKCTTANINQSISQSINQSISQSINAQRLGVASQATTIPEENPHMVFEASPSSSCWLPVPQASDLGPTFQCGPWLVPLLLKTDTFDKSSCNCSFAKFHRPALLCCRNIKSMYLKLLQPSSATLAEPSQLCTCTLTRLQQQAVMQTPVGRGWGDYCKEMI